MGTMLDTTDPSPAATFGGLPFDAVAAYVNGIYANYARARAEFGGRKPLLAIDVNGQGAGNTGDFESGDMSPTEAGSWAKGRIRAGVSRPVIYSSVSNWPAIMSSLRAAGLSRGHVRIWTAHYTGRAHLCSSACAAGVTGTADATQWGSPGTLPPPFDGHHLDVSMTAHDFFDEHPAHPEHHHHARQPAPHRQSGVPPWRGRPLSRGSSGKRVRAWQAQMRRRGFVLAADGHFGRESEECCRWLQLYLGHRPANGIVDQHVWQATWTVDRPVAAPGALPDIAPTHPAHVPPDRGDRNSRRAHPAKPADKISATFATLTPAQCKAAAAVIAKGARMMLANPAAVHYTEDLSLRWQGIRDRILIRQGRYITEGDCSSTATWLLWNALQIAYGIGDVVNGEGWAAGNTSTMATHGRPLPHGAPQRVGDLVLYGPPPADHVAVCLGGGYVFSHGGEAGPYKLHYNYRPVREIRRYFGPAPGGTPSARRARHH